MKSIAAYTLEIFALLIFVAFVFFNLNSKRINFYFSNSIIDFSIIPEIKVQSTEQDDFILTQEINLEEIHISNYKLLNEPLCAVFWTGLTTKEFSSDQPVYLIKLITPETTWEWVINNGDIGSHFQHYCPKDSQPVQKLLEAEKAYFEITTPYKNTQKYGQIILAPLKNSPPAIINAEVSSSLMLPYRLTANPAASMLDKLVYFSLIFFSSLIIWLTFRIGFKPPKKSTVH